MAAGVGLGVMNAATPRAVVWPAPDYGTLAAMPTRELEMFGMAAVEAQACGKPVAASDHGALRETFPETRLEALLDNRDLLDKLGAGARENAGRSTPQYEHTAG